MNPDLSSAPCHVAVIMDGNGRWAAQRGLPRIKGHEEGANSVRAVLEACGEEGVKYLTLYAFSVENWVRPKDEVRGLMRLLDSYLKSDEKVLHEKQIRLRVIGRLDDLPAALRKSLRRVCEETRAYDAGHLTVALSYGGRAELTDAARAIAREVRDGVLDPEAIDEATVASHLYAPDVPDPDLMIRTSGERRISNFLLWELSYAELYFTPVLWPDFRKEQFFEALRDYGARKRRFGGVEAPPPC
jgi:undecaprenyl diphosphate synthase